AAIRMPLAARLRQACPARGRARHFSARLSFALPLTPHSGQTLRPSRFSISAKGLAWLSRHLLPCRRKAPPAELPAKIACLKRRSRVASASHQNAIALLQVFGLQHCVRSRKMLALL